jgi:hypothetical protein
MRVGHGIGERRRSGIVNFRAIFVSLKVHEGWSENRCLSEEDRIESVREDSCFVMARSHSSRRRNPQMK